MLICLATFNGARWLPAQLDSLLNQDDEDWQLLVSDDRSTDATVSILQQYAGRDSRIEILPPRTGSAGACANFEYLLDAVSRRDPPANHVVALCDQDDIWCRDKLSVNRRFVESHVGCCSDVTLLKADGEPTEQRLLRQLKAPSALDAPSLLAQNSAMGCTLAFQSRVLRLALPFPDGLVNHDWWLALCISVIGELKLVDQPLVLYRQHAHNVVGAYRPVRQMFKLPDLITRQRHVLRSQSAACAELISRLSDGGSDIPRCLSDYRDAIGASSRRRRLSALLQGPFAAPHHPLRILRALASL